MADIEHQTLSEILKQILAKLRIQLWDIYGEKSEKIIEDPKVYSSILYRLFPEEMKNFIEVNRKGNISEWSDSSTFDADFLSGIGFREIVSFLSVVFQESLENDLNVNKMEARDLAELSKLVFFFENSVFGQSDDQPQQSQQNDITEGEKHVTFKDQSEKSLNKKQSQSKRYSEDSEEYLIPSQNFKNDDKVTDLGEVSAETIKYPLKQNFKLKNGKLQRKHQIVQQWPSMQKKMHAAVSIKKNLLMKINKDILDFEGKKIEATISEFGVKIKKLDIKNKSDVSRIRADAIERQKKYIVMRKKNDSERIFKNNDKENIQILSNRMERQLSNLKPLNFFRQQKDLQSLNRLISKCKNDKKTHRLKREAKHLLLQNQRSN